MRIMMIQIQTNVRILIFQQAKKIHKKAGDLNDGHQKMSFKQAKVGVESLCSGGQYNQPTLECARLER